ncbi:MAG: YraN family protein [Ruminococcaceae bacterium]|nr:YraN family protein [Oscillospiraceae bacterium]
MKSNLEKKRLGKLGEDIACAYLEKRGYAIAARNYTVRGGEIDIVAHDKEHVVFVEVKCRENDVFSKARDSVDAKKIAHLVTAAERFLFEKSNDPDFFEKQPRFDVIEVYTQKGTINHIKSIDIN